MVVTEHEHGHVRGGGELVEPLQLVRRDTAAVGAGSGRVEHCERDALELDCKVTGCDLFGDHRVVIAAHVVHAITEARVRVHEQLVLRLAPEVRQVTLHDDRVGIERLDLLDRAGVHDLRVRLAHLVPR